MSLKTWYVPYGRGQDRDTVRIKATTQEEAERLAYLSVGPIAGAAQPAKPIIDKRTIRGIKSRRKRGFKWSEIANYYSISVSTVKKYALK